MFQSSIFSSIAFLFSFFALTSGFYFYKKSVQKLNTVVWLPVTFITAMCYQALVAGIIDLIHIPVNILTLALFNYLFALFFWIQIVKYKKIQKYSCEKFDVLCTVVLLIGVAILGLIQFGPSLNIHYSTCDPGAHFGFTMDIVRTQSVSDMFFAQLNNALFIELLSPLTAEINYYKIFILSDIGMLFLSGMMFFATIRKYLTTVFLKWMGGVVVLIYLLAYPLNNMLFGFVYLGIGVTVISYLVFLTECYTHDQLDKLVNIILLSLGCLGIFLCYMLFMPVTFIAIFLCLMFYFIQHEQLFRLKTLWTYLGVFLIPCIIGLWYCYFEFFVGFGSTPTNAIAHDGYIYKNLFSNFIILLPFVVYGVYSLIKRKVWNTALFLLMTFCTFILIMLVMSLSGKASPYYYYKNYYPLWMIFSYLAMCGIHNLAKHAKRKIVAYSLAWTMIAVVFVSGIEQKIVGTNVLRSFFDIYAFNKENITNEDQIGQGTIDLYEYVIKNFGTDQTVSLAGSWLDYWYASITMQKDIKEHYYWQVGKQEFIDYLQQDESVSYVVVVKNSEIHQAYPEYFDSFPRVYENSTGYIAKIRNTN